LLGWLTLLPTWTPLRVTVHLRALAHLDPTQPRNDLRGRFPAARLPSTRSGSAASSLGPEAIPLGDPGDRSAWTYRPSEARGKRGGVPGCRAES